MGLECCRSAQTRLTSCQPGESPRTHPEGGCVARRLRGLRKLRAWDCTNVGPLPGSDIFVWGAAFEERRSWIRRLGFTPAAGCSAGYGRVQ